MQGSQEDCDKEAKNITHEDYKECFFSGNMQMKKMIVIRSHRFEIFTETINKIAFIADDDNIIIREDQISTFSQGQYKI